MSGPEFEDLAQKVLFGDATPEEVSQLHEAVAADPRRKAQMSAWQSEYERVREGLVTLDVIARARREAALPAERLERLMAPTPAPNVVQRPQKDWWRNQAAWFGLAAAACIALIFVFHSPGRRTTRENLQAGLHPGEMVEAPGEHRQPAKFDRRLVPQPETRFIDALLSWPAKDGEDFQLTVTRLSSAGSVEALHVKPPVSLEKLLLDGGLLPAPGVDYRVVVRRPDSLVVVWEWTFLVRADASAFGDELDDARLLAAATAEVGSSDATGNDAWQYLLRLSPAARNSDAAKAVERRLQSQAALGAGDQ